MNTQARAEVALRLLFTCSLITDEQDSDPETAQLQIWREIERKGINGFFLSHGSFYVCLLEGQQKRVISLVESLMRKRKIKDIDVRCERHVSELQWDDLFMSRTTFSSLPKEMYERSSKLAELVENTLDQPE